MVFKQKITFLGLTILAWKVQLLDNVEIFWAPKAEQLSVYELKFHKESISDSFRAVKARSNVVKHVFLLEKRKKQNLGLALICLSGAHLDTL